MQIIPNFLEKDVLDSILEKYNDSRGRARFEVNEMGRWTDDLYTGNFGPVYVLPLEEYMEYFTRKFSHIPVCENYTIAACFMHIWSKGSGIRWHQDSAGGAQRMAATIYLNEVWDSNWGGLFIYEKDGNHNWYNPQFNQCVWFESPMWHCVSIIANNIPEPRLSIQLFFNHK